MRVGHGRRFELIGSEEQKEVALHYLIRKRGKKLSEKIAEYDKLFRKNMGSHYNVDDKTIERYVEPYTNRIYVVHYEKYHNV